MLGGLREVMVTYVDENGNRELREVPQPASAEYLSTLREAETNSRYFLFSSLLMQPQSPLGAVGVLGLVGVELSQFTRWETTTPTTIRS